MALNLKIWAALMVAVFCAAAAFWQFANVRGIRARGRRRNSSPDEKARIQAQRSSDQHSLSRQDKKLYIEAKRLMMAGKVIPAARILEQLKMPREAIQTLEDNGFIHEAARILMRMQRNNRAGVVYARHKMWEHAAQCFKMANMPLDVAKCARELGQMDVAGEYYEMAHRWGEAAECFETAGFFHRAAKLFGMADLPKRQIAMYQRMAASSASTPAGVDFDESEIKQIADYIGRGHVDANLAAVLGRKGRLSEVVLRLLASSLHREAAELLQTSVTDLGPQLISAVNYQDNTAPALAELFVSVASFNYAGMVYERLNAFDRAALVFEKAGDFTRAAYCYERAGRSAEAQMLRHKGRPATLPKPQPGNRQGFNLADIPETRIPEELNHPDDGEATAVLSPPQAPSAAKGRAKPGRDKPQMVKAPVASSAPAQVVLPLIIDLTPRDEELTAAVPLHRGGPSLLEKVQFCVDLDQAQRQKLWSIGKAVQYLAEETILTYDQEPQGLYLIVKGSVSCYRRAGTKETYIDQMGESESFGELWLLADQPTAVRFVATKATEIRLIERDPFHALLDKDGTIARKLYRRFTIRLLSRLLKPVNSSKSSAVS